MFQRPLFLLYNRKLSTRPISVHDLPDMSRYGLKTDVIVCAYLTSVPLLASISQAFIQTDFLPQFMTFYNAATAIVAGLMVIADTALYSFWQHKIDASVLAYLKTLKWAIASVSTLYIAGSIFALLMVAGCTYCWLELVCEVSMSHGTFIAHGIAESIVTALTGIALIGVLQQQPVLQPCGTKPGVCFHILSRCQ